MSIENILKQSRGSKKYKWLVILRIALGLTLFWKGILFIQNSDMLNGMIMKTGMVNSDDHIGLLSLVISFINLLGGLFIATGLFTKWSAIVQIPILLVAVFFVNIKEGVTFELVLSAIVLILLIVFAIKGSGVLSADEYFREFYKTGPVEDGG